MIKISCHLFGLFLLSFIAINIVFCGDAETGSNLKSNNVNKLRTASTNSKLSLITINEDDWEQMLNGEWMVEFHAPWCPACRALQPEWKSFSSWSSDLGIKVGAVDVTENPGLSGRFMVTALPTIYHIKDSVFRQYKGSRDSNSFVSFIEEKKWRNIDPVSSWKSPNSLQMSIVSNFFKISMALRGIHNILVEDYGIPYWGSYILFAFATILFGALLGLMIVCFIDLIFPAKAPEDIIKRPATQGDIIDDTEDKKNDDYEEETEEEDLDNEDEQDEEEDEDEDDEEERIVEVDEDDKPVESSPEQRRAIRLRKTRRD